MKKSKKRGKKVTDLKKLVDGSKKEVLQEGLIGEHKQKASPLKETLSEKEIGEKLAYQRVLKQLVPAFPIQKLEKQTLVEVRKFFEGEVNPIIQETILIKYKDLRP